MFAAELDHTEQLTGYDFTVIHWLYADTVNDQKS